MEIGYEIGSIYTLKWGWRPEYREISREKNFGWLKIYLEIFFQKIDNFLFTAVKRLKVIDMGEKTQYNGIGILWMRIPELPRLFKSI